MAPHKTLKELLIEYGSVVLIVAFVCGPAGYGAGQLHRGYWRDRAEIAEQAQKDLTAERDKTRAELTSMRGLAEKSAAANKEIEGKMTNQVASLQEKDQALSASQSALNAKSQEATRLTRENATLRAAIQKYEKQAADALAPRQEANTNSIVKAMYRRASICDWELVRELRVPIGFIHSQFETLKSSNIIDLNISSVQLQCANLTSTGRKFAEQNGLD